MASLVAEDYSGSNLTQVQNGVNLPLTNPDIQGYAIRLSSKCIFRPVALGLRLMLLDIHSVSTGFIAHLCVGEDNRLLGLVSRQ